MRSADCNDMLDKKLEHFVSRREKAKNRKVLARLVANYFHRY